MILATVLYLTHLSSTVIDTFEADQDVWVYPHAGDPGGDSSLRVWGVGGKSVAPTAADAENFSYGYLRFTVQNLPQDRKLKSVKLVLTSAGKPVIDDSTKDWPLEVRPLKGTFEEKSFSHDQVAKVFPDAQILFGSAVVSQIDSQDPDSRGFCIELMNEKSNFSRYFAELGGKPLYLALTSKYDTAELGMKGIYKVYSRDNKDVRVRPRLEFSWE